MAPIWWVTTIGFVLCLGFLVGSFIHFLRRALNSEDAYRIDPIKSDHEE
ncbi:MAG: hypothetical protein ACJ8MO_02585 [Bacillus sp. (in: firmicutes)]|jgi:uncharacterized membrane protein SpoIIM required for sporulation